MLHLGDVYGGAFEGFAIAGGFVLPKLHTLKLYDTWAATSDCDWTMPLLKNLLYEGWPSEGAGSRFVSRLPSTVVAIDIIGATGLPALHEFARFTDLEWLAIQVFSIHLPWPEQGQSWPALKHLKLAALLEVSDTVPDEVMPKMDAFLDRREFPVLKQIECKWDCEWSEHDEDIAWDWGELEDRFKDASIDMKTEWCYV